MYILIFLIPYIIKGCQFYNQTVNASNLLQIPCEYIQISNCTIFCEEFDIVKQHDLTNFNIYHSTIRGCDQFSFNATQSGIIYNLTILEREYFSPEERLQINLPQLLYFQADNLDIIDMINNDAIQSCILISNNKFQLNGTIKCPSIVMHQFVENLTLSTVKIISTNINSKVQPIKITDIVGFVEVSPEVLDNTTYWTKADLSVENTLKRLNKTLRDLHYSLVSPQSMKQVYTILIMVQNGSLRIKSEVSISGSRIALFAKSIIIEGSVIAQNGFPQNQGPGRGVSFQYTGAFCAGSGGSSAGYGGSGVVIHDKQTLLSQKNQDCFLLVEAIKFMAQLHPYNLGQKAGLGSGGGEQYGAERILHKDQSLGSGGGYIKIEVEDDLQINGILNTDGKTGYQNLNINNVTQHLYSGGGGGGSILLSARRIFGSGKITARGGDSDKKGYSGEGGGGLIVITTYDQFNVDQDQGIQKSFNGILDVSKGKRDLSSYDIGKNISVDDFFGTDGTIILPGCPEGHYLKNLICLQCPTGTYSFMHDANCTKCPGVPEYKSGLEQCVHVDSTELNSNPMKFISGFVTSMWGILAYITLFIVIVAGYIIRRIYRLKEAHIEQLPFDFESATKHMVLTHIITDTLRNNPDFQLVDLIYHAHRVVLQGSNTFNYPWSLPIQPTEEISYIVDIEEWNKFTQRLNKLAEWKKWEFFVLLFLGIFYYPLYWVMIRHFKKKKFEGIKYFVHNSDIKLWKFLNAEEQVSIKLKLSKSADYTLLYLDIFNYKTYDLKYLFLTCPYIILLSGEGNYIRPFYLCESDPFISCLYFAINKTCDHDQDDERYRIMEKLVAHKKRMENSTRMNKFLLKFNRYARTVDYGSSPHVFSEQIKVLIIFLKTWNERFFAKLTIRLDLVVLQTPCDGIGNQLITILENADSPKIKIFLREIHQKYTLKLMLDIKFGIFIYDTEVDANEIDDAFNNQKISFFEQPRANSFLNVEIDEEEEVNINDLKDQFVNRTNKVKQAQTQTLLDQQKQSSESYQQKTKKSNRQPILHLITYFFHTIRYQFASHRLTTMNKYTAILVQLVLAFVDAIFLPVFLVGNVEELMGPNRGMINIQFLFIPFPMVMFIAPFIGCLWMSTQSYGIAKLHLLLTSMSSINLGLNIFLKIFVISGEVSIIAVSFLIANMIVKVGLIRVGKCILSINVKLNKMNQAKHISAG